MRIAGINIPDKKHLDIGLIAVYGIGRSRARDVLRGINIPFSAKPGDISPEKENKLRQRIESYMIEGDLRRERSGNIKRLRDIQAFRGTRHSKGLPVRGQRTKVNSRTVRGNVRKTMGSGKRKVEKK